MHFSLMHQRLSPDFSNSPHLHYFTFGSGGSFTCASQGSLSNSEAVGRSSSVHVRILLRKARKASDWSAVIVCSTRSRDDSRIDSSVSFGASPLGDPSSLKNSRARGPESYRSRGGGGPSKATIRASWFLSAVSSSGAPCLEKSGRPNMRSHTYINK